ncbi:MAG: enoyl-CoA hydratase/isomerase family protein [Acidimicrobiaceae bacterium]|jgi:enoyl-CoA hydratase|nr:enoyl-CoA hydratase/isomerase family protein [Acidimicrobiaceae bacterium]MBT5850255.1 enoyl-CoA hydratase/isomerase family protein [Acidimicrobiaceae bacterium]
MADDWFEKHEGLRFERREHGILWMTIDRPDALNATTAAMHRSLSRVWDDINDDPDTRVVVVTGEGDAFSAGGDLEWISSFVGDPVELRQIMREAGDVVYRMLRCEKIIISAINGVAVGAGLAVALMADISLIDEEARFTDGHLKIGVAAGDHAAICWPLLCGMAKAKYYLLTADFIDGKTADQIGLVSKAVPGDELLAEAQKVATKLATGPQQALQLTKRALNLWMDQAAPIFDASLAFEMLGFLGPEGAEGVRSMQDKRRPDFTN